MADQFSSRDVTGLSHRAYTLRPAHSLLYRVTLWLCIGGCSAVMGAVGLHAWHVHRDGARAQCGDATLDEATQQTELARARLALTQEMAARAAVQKTADNASAEVARLTSELQFLRGQSKRRR